MVRFDKPKDSKKLMRAVFKINGGTEKGIDFGSKDKRYYVKSKDQADRTEFIRNYDQSKERNPVNPEVLERYVLSETSDKGANIQIYLDKFNIKKHL